MQPPQPKMHPPPEESTTEKSEYVPANTDFNDPSQINEMAGFIASVHGQAKALDKKVVGDSQYTKGVTFDAPSAIKELAGSPVNNQPPVQLPHMPVQSVPTAQQASPNVVHQSTMNPGDSLILKSEIDKIKEQVNEIKKLYDEFFKLKTVKGKWLIKTENKEQSAPSIAKAWNILNKLLKNKTNNINIVYTEEPN